MTPEAFSTLMAELTAKVAGAPLDDALERRLNAELPVESELVRRVADACEAGIRDGWICAREAGGIRYGRVVKPTAATQGFSVDVVEMNEVAGGHHVHPNGEIDLVLPVDPNARFDGRGAGWVVYGPGSAHVPTVAGGKARVLYLLPQGAIEFTKGR